MKENGRHCRKKSILCKGKVMGMNRIKGSEKIRRLERWRGLLSDSKQLQGKLCQGFENNHELGTVRNGRITQEAYGDCWKCFRSIINHGMTVRMQTVKGTEAIGLCPGYSARRCYDSSSL